MERVSRAFLFHKDLSNRDEGASVVEALEHVLWYFPEGAPPEERVKYVGLAQALLSFGDRFRRRKQSDGESKEHTATTRGPYEESVELVRTKRHCHGFLECEPGLWLVFVLSNRQVYSRSVTRQLGWPAPSKRAARDGLLEGISQVAGSGRPVGASSISSRNRLRTAVFGRVGSSSSGRVSPEKRAFPPPTREAKLSSTPTVDSVGVSIMYGSDNGGGRVHSGEGDWVDETALRALMARAYETFALLHGSVQSVLDAPVRVLKGVSGEGTNSDREVGVISGLEILRRLSDARKRLRRKASRMTDEASPEASEVELHEAVQEREARNSHEEGMRLEETEISALLRVSPVEVLKETLYNFFVGYLPGTGLAQPHFHIDLGYPQSLPMDSYRRQLGQRMRQRIRRRLHSVLANESNTVGDETLDVDIVITLSGGALLLACIDPPTPATVHKPPNTNRKQNQKDSELIRLKEAETTLASSGSTSGFDCGNGVEASADTAYTPGRSVELEGRDVSLLLSYLCSLAGAAERLLKIQEDSEAQAEAEADAEGTDGDSSRASSSRSSSIDEEGNVEVSRDTGEDEGPGTDLPGPPESETNANGNPESSPSFGGSPNAIWAALRSGFVNDEDDHEYVGVRNNEGVGPSKKIGKGRRESKGLLCCDGSLAACDGSFTTEDLGGNTRIWAPRLHDILRVRNASVRDPFPRVAPTASDVEFHDSCSRNVGDGRRQTRVMAYLRGGVCALVAFRDKRGAGCKSDDGFLEPEHRRDEDETRKSDGFTEPELGRGAGDKVGSGDTWDSGSCFYYNREYVSGKEIELSEAELLQFGRAIETSLSEDPDLAVLEDDANDLCGGHYGDSSTLRSSLPVDDDGGVGRRFSKFGLAVRDGNSRKPPPREGHQRQRSKSGKPLRAVRHMLSPLPNFSAAGLFHNSDGGALVRSRRCAVERPLACLSARDSFPRVSHIEVASNASLSAVGDDMANSATSGFSISGSGEGVFVVVDGDRPPSEGGGKMSPEMRNHHCLDRGFDSISSAFFRREVYGDAPRSETTRRYLSSYCNGGRVVCLGGSLGKHNPLRAVMTGTFSPILEAFGLRGRADGGIEDMKRGGSGGAHELAVLDDVHASVRVIHPGQHTISSSGTAVGAAYQTRDSESVSIVEGSGAGSVEAAVVRRVDSSVREIGVRTSMSTGNRWVIGRYEGVASDSRGDDGESVMYATLEAPILSVGDARAAADSMFSGSGVGGSGIKSNDPYRA